MTYKRVIPRDLFNEANLLKCWGALWIALEGKSGVTIQHGPHHDGESNAFDVDQSDSDGSLWVRNLVLVIHGIPYMPTRPLNSREPFPLYLDDDDDGTAIFDDDGTLSADFVAILEGR